MTSKLRQPQRNSGRVLAFLALAVLPPAVLSACGSLFNKDVDAGADAAVEVVDAAPVVEAEPVESAPLASTVPTPVVVVRTDAGAKKVDAGTVADAAAPAAVVDAGIPIPRPVPSGLKVPGLPSGFKIPSGIPSRFLPR